VSARASPASSTIPLLQSFHGLLLRFQAAHNLLPGRAVDARQVLEAAIDTPLKPLRRHAMRFRICARPPSSPSVWRRRSKYWVEN